MQPSERGVLAPSSIHFHTPSTLARSGPFHLACIGEFFCDGHYRVDRQTFNSYLVMFIRAGSGSVTVNRRTVPVRAGDVVFLDCHQPHAYQSSVGWEILWVHFDGSACAGFFQAFADRHGPARSLGESGLVPQALVLLMDGFRRGRPAHDILLGCHLHRLLAELLLIDADPFAGSGTASSPVMDAIAFIHDRYPERITVEELAAHCNLSAFHFSRLFKKETGYAPYEYVLKTRIDEAKARLKNTRLSVKEIAYAVGFNSEAHFVKTFHASVALTPNSFRHTPM